MNEIELAEIVDAMEDFEREHGPTLWVTLGTPDGIMSEREGSIASAELKRRGCKSSPIVGVSSAVLIGELDSRLSFVPSPTGENTP